MKIMLFQDGKPGVAEKLPGENPEAELADLLGGETEMTPLTERLLLVTRKDGEELELPVRYAVHGLGREPRRVAGDIAVVAVRPEGILRDVTKLEITAAEATIQAVME